MKRFAETSLGMSLLGVALFVVVASTIAHGATVDRIVFHSDRDGNPDIYIWDPDGTDEPDQLTDDPHDDEYASFCGEDKIVFSSNRHKDNNDEFFIEDLVDNVIRKYAI